MLGEDLYFLILETFLMRLIISVYELGAGMGVDGWSCGSLVGDSLGGDDDGIITFSSSTVGSDGGIGKVLNNLLMCICSNQGIGSRMSSGP